MPTGWRRTAIDAVALFVYLGIVYVFSVGIYPLGRDYAMLENPSADLPVLSSVLWKSEVSMFGAWVPGYHLVNLALLYACMLLIYRVVKRIVQGPFWLGTLAATLFMANPVHSEAVLNLCGVVDLMPCLCALAALTAYLENAAQPRAGTWLLALALLALAIVQFPQNLGLVLVLALYEVLLADRTESRRGRWSQIALVATVACVLHRELFTWQALAPARMFSPLYFIFYPVGFLPETVRTFVFQPWWGWVAAAAVVVILTLIYRKARRPAILFGLLAMLAVRLFQGDRFVDPVHLIGGGQLLLANVFFNVALVALFRRMMDHPKWVRPIVSLTSLLCVFFFGLEIRSEFAWRQAGAWVQQFQEDAKMWKEPITVFPDYQFYRGAPMCLSEAVIHKTPFGSPVRAASALPLNYDPLQHLNFGPYQGGPRGLFVGVIGDRVADSFCYPYALARRGGHLETDAVSIDVVTSARDARIGRDRVTLHIAAKHDDLQWPEAWYPDRSNR